MRQQGGAGGLSTFSLSAERGGDAVPMTEREFSSRDVTLRERPEILEALKQPLFASVLFEDFQESVAAAKLQVPQGTVDSARATGTYIDLPEVCHMYKTYNRRLTEGEAGAGDDQLRDSIPAVHVADSHGQRPYTMKHFQVEGGCVLYLIINVLLHCRELHRLFCAQLNSQQQDQRDPLLVGLQSLCKAAESKNMKSFSRARLRGLAQRLFDLIGEDIAMPRPAEKCVVNIFRQLIPSVKVF